MPCRKKKINVEVHMPSKENIKEFQNRVNRILAEIIETRIEKEKMATNKKNGILSELKTKYMIK
ncbi:hypothetical protein [Faecalimonas sp.]